MKIVRNQNCLAYYTNLLRLIIGSMARPAGATPLTLNSRFVLAAYMIFLHPDKSFEMMGFTETKVFASAEKMLKMFEEILQLIATGTAVPDLPEQLKVFPTVVSGYFADFNEWKTPDALMAEQRMIRALVGLHQAMQALSDADEDDRRNELEAQIARITDKLQQVAGNDGMARLQQALQTSAPTGFLTSGRMRTEQLAYELFLDSNFKFNDEGLPSTEQSDRKLTLAPAMDDSFWEIMANDIEVGIYTTVLAALREVQIGFKDILGTAFTGDVQDEVLELTNTDQFGAGLRHWPNCVKLLTDAANLVLRLQMQHRDAAGRAKWQELLTALQEAEQNPDNRAEAFCNALRFSEDGVHKMRIDGCNQRLQTIAPVLQQPKTAIDYLQMKFAARRQRAGFTLERTEKWLTAAIDETPVKEFRKLVAGSGATLRSVHLAALVNLVMGFNTSTPLPEVFVFDRTRLEYYCSSIEQLITCGTVMRIICNSTEDEVIPTPRDIDSMLDPKPAESQFQFISCCVQSLSLEKPEDSAKILAILKGSTLKFTEDSLQAVGNDLAMVLNPNFIERIYV